MLPSVLLRDHKLTARLYSDDNVRGAAIYGLTYGGVPESLVARLKPGIFIVFATPGKLINMLDKSMRADDRLLICLGKVQIVVYEEGQEFLLPDWIAEFAKLECYLPTNWNRWYITSEVNQCSWDAMILEIDRPRSVLLNHLNNTSTGPTHIQQFFPQVPSYIYLEYLITFIEVNPKARMLIVSKSTLTSDFTEHC